MDSDGKYIGWVKRFSKCTELPCNIQDYLLHHTSNLQININTTDAINGYGIAMHGSVIVMLYCEECRRPCCDYNSLFNSDPQNDCHKRHGRHSLKRGYEPVFTWTFNSEIPLEDAFNSFLERNNDYKDIKPMTF